MYGREFVRFSFKVVVGRTEEIVVAAQPNHMSEYEIHAFYEEFGVALDTGFVTPEELMIVMESAQAIVEEDSITAQEAEDFLSLLTMASEPGEMSLVKERSGDTDMGDSLVPALDSL